MRKRTALSFADEAAKIVETRNPGLFVSYLESVGSKLPDYLREQVVEGPVTDHLASYSSKRIGMPYDPNKTEVLKVHIRRIFKSSRQKGKDDSKTIREIIRTIPKAVR